MLGGVRDKCILVLRENKSLFEGFPTVSFYRQEVIATSDAAPQLSFSKRWLRISIPYLLFVAGIVAGVALGIEHFRDGMRALFVFKAAEPIPSYVAVASLLGTLPATLLALIHPRAASCVLWVLAGSIVVVGTLFFFPVEPNEPWVLDALRWFAGWPAAQALVGAIFWYSRRPGQSD